MKNVFLIIALWGMLAANGQSEKDSTTIYRRPLTNAKYQQVIESDTVYSLKRRQVVSPYSVYDTCGVWEILPYVFSEWQPVDTLKKMSRYPTSRFWVYREFEQISPNLDWPYVLKPYYPCGYYPDYVYERFRVCLITGIVERQTKTIQYKYRPKPKTLFEEALERLKNDKD